MDNKIYYAVFTPEGELMINTINHSEYEACNFASCNYNFNYLAAKGYTVRPITISEVKSEINMEES